MWFGLVRATLRQNRPNVDRFRAKMTQITTKLKNIYKICMRILRKTCFSAISDISMNQLEDVRKKGNGKALDFTIINRGLIVQQRPKQSPAFIRHTD